MNDIDNSLHLGAIHKKNFTFAAGNGLQIESDSALRLIRSPKWSLNGKTLSIDFSGLVGDALSRTKFQSMRITGTVCHGEKFKGRFDNPGSNGNL